VLWGTTVNQTSQRCSFVDAGRSCARDNTLLIIAMKTIIFFTVSLVGNIPTLHQSISRINKFYNHPPFTIICPAIDVIEFEQNFLGYKNVSVISENEYLTLQQLNEIALSCTATVQLEPQEQRRLSWYYQQILKINFLLTNVKKNTLMVMWDADTVPLVRIKFFNKDKAQLYGSKVEFHQPYFETLSLLFAKLPKNFLAFTIQFFNCNYDDVQFLNACLHSYAPKPKNESISAWLGQIVLKSTIERHGKLISSGFSEQELVGVATMLNNHSIQKPLYYLRGGFEGVLTDRQLLVVACCGFKHITYENIAKLQEKRQRWMPLLAFIIKQIIRQRIIYKRTR
jgi:hypothetical protein